MKLDVELAVNHEPQENSSSFSKTVSYTHLTLPTNSRV